MAAISSLQIGGVTYDIYAKSAEQAPVGSHELSSHSHFSTYFNGTSANSALTSKSALSAGSASKAVSATSALTAGSADKVKLTSLDNASNYQVILGATGTQNLYYDSDLKIQYNTSSNTFYSPNISATNISANTISAGKLTGTQFVLVSASATEANITAANAAGVNAINNPKIGFWNSAANQKGYIIWTDYNNSNTWVNADSAFFGAALSDGFVVTSDQLNSILVSKNLSATNFKAAKMSATNLSATNITGTLEGAARRLAKRSISFSRTVAQSGDGKKWCRIASISRPNFTTASEWGSSEAELNIYTKSYGENNTVDRGKIVLYCRWGHASASSPTYSMKTNGSRGARWLYWKPQQTSTSVSADSSVSAYVPFSGLKDVDIKIVATDTSVEWWLYNDVWDTTLEITESYSNNIALYGKDSAKTLGDFKTYIEDNRSQWDDVYGDGSYINYALSAKSAPVASHTISSHSDSANFFSGNSARSACSATSAKNAGTATSAGTAANVNASQWNADSARYILFGENKASTTVGYDSDFTYNPSSNKLLVKNISSTNITATTFSGTLSGNASSAKNAGTATYATSAGAAPLVGHNHGMMASSYGKALNADTSVSTWSGQFGVLNNGYWLYSIRGQSTAPSWFAPNFAAGIAFGGDDTKGVISVQYDSPKIKIAGGNGKTSASAPVWWIGLNGTNGKTYTLPGDNATLVATTGIYTAANQLSARSAVSAGSASNSLKLSGTDGSAVIGSAQSGYKALTALSALSGVKTFKTINAGTTAINADSSADAWTLKVTGVMSMSADTATKTITLSSRDNNSTAYIPSGFQVSGINGTTTGVYYLSALKLNAGTNIGFTSASNSQITITAKDTTYTSLNGINSTEYNALTSTSANSRNPNAHPLSSHTNFSTYFNGTSANSALTAKSAQSAGIATKTQITDHTANDTDYAPIWTNTTNSSLFTTSSKYKFNPAAGRLYVSNIVKVGGCSMTWNASTSALDFNF